MVVFQSHRGGITTATIKVLAYFCLFGRWPKTRLYLYHTALSEAGGSLTHIFFQCNPGISKRRQAMTKYEIQANTEKCTGCLRCQLGCSDVYTKMFNPLAAYIRVSVSEAECSISFTEGCTKCGICADHCFYDALRKRPEESNS